MTQIDERAIEGAWHVFYHSSKPAPYNCFKEAIEAYESFRAPRTITREEFWKVQGAIIKAYQDNAVLWIEPAAKAALATLGIAVEG